MIFPRNIYKSLTDHASQKQVTVITGMRRTGKTTLVKHLLSEKLSENSLYIDLERLDNRHLFNEVNYENIILALKQRGLIFNKRATIAIDEAQFSPSLPSVVKYLYDTYDIKFIITGSSSYYLKNLYSESLAGRKKIFELFTLEFGEFLTFKSIPWIQMKDWDSGFSSSEYELLNKQYEEFLEYGGFPEVVLQPETKVKNDLLEDIISSYINIDIKWLSDFKNAENIRNLIIMLASRAASKLDNAKMSALTGLSKPTVANYTELFEQTYLISRVQVVSNNPDREIVKARKLYFSDNGILNRLTKVSGGVLFENGIFNQLKHLGSLNYYSLKTGQEIDFILDKNIALEVKETATSSDYKNLSRLSERLKIKKQFLISRYLSKTFSSGIWGGSIK